jgi:uncharacterized protein YbjT (DUF2867 family)
MKIVVIGGTGLIGTKVVGELSAHGHETVAASPKTGVNTLTGQGLGEILKDAEVLVDVTNSPSFENQAMMDFFKTSTSNVIKYGVAAGVRHLVALSVVGADRLSESPYIQAKLVQEKIIKESGLPFSIIHATQFFEFLGTIADISTEGNLVRLAPVLVQPMAADDVARALARISIALPVRGTVEFGGPDKFRLDEIIRLVLNAEGDSREVIADPASPYYGAHVSERTLVPGDDAQLGKTRCRDWLASLTKQAIGQYQT